MTEMGAKDFRQVFDVDFKRTVHRSKRFHKSMLKKGGGKIISICSMLSELDCETVSAYAASKGGLKMFTKNIASEYGGFNIKCNCIGRGYIVRKQCHSARLRPTAAAPLQPVNHQQDARIPWGTPDDLHGPAVFLARLHPILLAVTSRM